MNSHYFVPSISTEINASGAVRGALRKDIVLIVDVIDMSTSAEALLEQGPIELFGSSLDHSKPPVAVNPFGIGERAGKIAIQEKTQVLIVAEPRLGDIIERQSNINQLLEGIKTTGAMVEGPYPNMGAELGRRVNAKNKVVVIASDTGGVAWDAAYFHGAAKVLTGTIARTCLKKGKEAAATAVKRCMKIAVELESNITVVAASGNSLEDILAAQYIMTLMNYFSVESLNAAK